MGPAEDCHVMSARLVAVSGLGTKGPAAFLLETGARRILLDFGQGPDHDALPSFEEIGIVDALVLSHGHKDHLGAAVHIDRIGRPPVFATDQVLRQVSADLDRRSLPPRGHAEIFGLMVQTGRNGHAPGGIWLRFDVGQGFLYTGDYSRESAVYAFDELPAATTVLLDASYGADERPLSFGQSELARMAAAGPILLPAPADGRAPDMALFLHEQGYDVALDEGTRDAARMLAEEPGQTQPDVGKRLAALVRTTRRLGSDSPVEGVMIASNGTGSSGISAALIERWRSQSGPQIVFTGHVGKGTPAERLVSAGRADIVRWNVHPRLQDNLQLARAVKAQQIIPAFLNLEDAQGLRTAFRETSVTIERVVAL
jgi:Cft2 family RNA processing exonuclease